MRHVTSDTWQLTCDTWHMVGGDHCLKISALQLLRFGINTVLNRKHRPKGRCFENPTYGRHRISWPMRIEAPFFIIVKKKIPHTGDKASLDRSQKNFISRCGFRQLLNKNFQIWDHLFPLLFPKDSQSLKILDIWLREVGQKDVLLVPQKATSQTPPTCGRSMYAIQNNFLFLGLYELVEKCKGPPVEHLPCVDNPRLRGENL